MQSTASSTTAESLGTYMDGLCSIAKLYKLPKEYWPEHLRNGRKIIVTEPKAQYVDRIRSLGGFPSLHVTLKEGR